jgi:hypothetical protein
MMRLVRPELSHRRGEQDHAPVDEDGSARCIILPFGEVTRAVSQSFSINAGHPQPLRYGPGGGSPEFSHLSSCAHKAALEVDSVISTDKRTCLKQSRAMIPAASAENRETAAAAL